MLHTSVCYRLYVGDQDLETLSDICDRYFRGYTIYLAVGAWQGKREGSNIIEIIGTPLDLQAVVFLAGDIREVWGEQAVMVTSHEVTRLAMTEVDSRAPQTPKL